ncbi:hypothetical protein CEXT_413201 [Caerostris extrusa]|uniref:Uncharacterized protein n=1 Tax=Caerostris extrusa TaxID=172846 RepID=A0AAV4N1I9_CAEEX|nr:hypothetical protein CEXT_413201 [Caerostris extrusa]
MLTKNLLGKKVVFCHLLLRKNLVEINGKIIPYERGTKWEIQELFMKKERKRGSISTYEREEENEELKNWRRTSQKLQEK